MVTFKITHPATTAVSWLADVETVNGPIFSPVTVAPGLPIALDVPVGIPVPVWFITYGDPVGTIANQAGIFVASYWKTLTLEDGKTYNMDMSTGKLVGASGILGNSMVWVIAAIAVVGIMLIKKKK
jgi:hypothetical protein